MDFYGFSSEVGEANAMNSSSDLANNAYMQYNAGAESAYRAGQIKVANKAVTDAQNTLGTDTTREAKEGAEQGGGTVFGAGGVYKLGKEIVSAGNDQAKAIRIAEAHVKLAKASGDADEIEKAGELLKSAKLGKLSEFAKNAASIATGALGKTKSGEAIAKLGDSIASKGAFAVSSNLLQATKAGRQATDTLAQAAKATAEKAAQPAEDIAKAAGGAIQSGEAAFDMGSNFAANGGELAAQLSTAKSKLASLADDASPAQRRLLQKGVDKLTAQIGEQGAGGATEATASTLKSSLTTENIQSDQSYSDPRDTEFGGGGLEGDAADAGTTLKTQLGKTSDVISTLGARANQVFIGEERTGKAATTAIKGLAAPTQVLDKGSDIAAGVIAEGGSVAQKINGFSQLAEGNKAAASAARKIGSTYTPPNLEPEPERSPYDSEEDTSRAEQEAETSAKPEDTSGPTQSIADQATEAGTAEHEAAKLQGGGLDTRGLDAGTEALKAAAEAGGYGTKTAAFIGRGALTGIKAAGSVMKVANPLINAAFTVDQTKDEIESIASGKGLSGDGWQGKLGGVLEEGGDIASTIAPALAAFGPLGDAAALGVEIGGGLASLAGDLLGDWGTADKEAKQRQQHQAALDAANKKAKAAKSSYNKAVETASAAGNVNLAGQGTIAQVSRSAVRTY
tara:strand:- start:503 stop:2542 length:2040 start_codon:yes stop_codon:yes gene_type:complete